MNMSCTRSDKLFRHWRLGVVCLAIFASAIHDADAQIYEPGSTVLGKTTTEYFADTFNWTIASLEYGHIKDLSSERVYENQHGPAFFLPRERDASFSEYAVIDVPLGAPMALGFPTYYGKEFGAENNRHLALGVYRPTRSLSVTIDGLKIDVDPNQYTEQTWMDMVNRQTSGSIGASPQPYVDSYIIGPFLLLEPLEPGSHRIEVEYDGPVSTYRNVIPINVVAPERVELALGETYSQDFDRMGADGEAVKAALPLAWTVTDEWGFALQRDTDAEFPIAIRPRPGAFPFVTNAGVPGEDDRALSIYMPRESESLSLESDVTQLQFLAQSTGAADSLQVQFDFEVWDGSSGPRAANPGEPAFDVTIDIDAGNGFQPLLDLGRVTAGELRRSTGDYLNGNDAANRVSFDSGILPVAIPSGSQLRMRWAAPLDGNMDGWVFGIDNFSITLSGDVGELAGDFNGDGLLDIDDLNALSTAIQANRVDVQYDLDGSGVVDLADRQHWVSVIKKTWLGDANLDGIFDSGDMVSVFIAGEYEDAIAGNSTWATGDWNGDGDFNTSDMVSAFLDGGYEAGPRAAVSAVPEPSTILLTAIALLSLGRVRKK